MCHQKPKDRAATRMHLLKRCRLYFAAFALTTFLPSMGQAQDVASPIRIVNGSETVAAPTSSGDAPSESTGDLFHDGRRLKSVRKRGRRDGARSKQEIERERQKKLEATIREIDEIYADYGSRISRKTAKMIGAIYARYSTRFQDSIGDQVRAILAHALRLNIFVPREFIFFDLAARGYKANRAGLAQVEQTVRSGKAKALLLFSTSRLFRKTYRTLQFVDIMHRSIGARCIFVKSGVDTDDKQRWEALLAVQSMVDQFVVSMYVANVQAAHEGLLAKKLVFGSLSLGYWGEPIDGEFTRRNKPRCKIAIDDEVAEIVRRIFRWYAGVDEHGNVGERLTIQGVIQRLNEDLSIDLPPGCTSGRWTRAAVRRILSNTRYRGLWRYGVMEAVYVPEADYTKQKLRAEPLAEVQLDELRIIPDELWFAVQKRLAKDGARSGRPVGSGTTNRHPGILNQLVHCYVHTEQQLHVAGAYGARMLCPACRDVPAKERPLFTMLRRIPATAIICDAIATKVQTHAGLAKRVKGCCLREVAAAQQPDPVESARLDAEIKQLERSIAFTRRTVGPTESDEDDAERQIRGMSADLTAKRAQQEVLRLASSRRPKMPSDGDLDALVQTLGKTLAEASTALDPAAQSLAARILQELIDGPILIEQQGERKRKRGWLRARFRLRVLTYLTRAACGQSQVADDDVEMVVDLVEPTVDEKELGPVWKLYEADLLNREIAKALKVPKSKVERLLRILATQKGLSLPDGRARRGRILQNRTDNAVYKRIAADFEKLVDMLYGEIAEMYGCDLATVQKAAAYFYASRGETPPDGRSRRWKLTHNKLPPTSADDAA